MGRAPAPSMRAKAMPSAGLAALRSSLAVSMAVASFPVEQILLSCDRGRRLRQRHGPCDARVAVSRPLAWALACALAARPSRRRGVLFPGLRANLPDALHVGDLRLAPPRSPARLSAAWYLTRPARIRQGRRFWNRGTIPFLSEASKMGLLSRKTADRALFCSS